MGRKRLTRELAVSMNGREVGRLKRVTQGVLSFQYRTEWLAAEAATPISLSMPLSNDPYTGNTVWNFFDNLLPDNQDTKIRMQRSLGAESTRPFDLLAEVGKDCVGALQIHDPEEQPDVRLINADPVTDLWIAERLRGLASKRNPLGMAQEEDFRISIAGAHEKTALLWHKGSWHRPNGTTPTTHILKLPLGVLRPGIDFGDSVENEWLCLRIAAAFGLPVPQARIQDFDGERALVVERFDRRWASGFKWLIRLPQEDTCQALGLPSRIKYESDGGPGIATILELLLQSEKPTEDRRSFFRAQVVYWMLAAIDGHAKNFSLFLHAGGRCRLTPLYDIVSAYPLVARRKMKKPELKMAMAVDGSNRHYHWQEIQGRHWISAARKARFSETEARNVVEECFARVPEVVEEVTKNLPKGYPEDVAQAIFKGLTSVQMGDLASETRRRDRRP